MVARKIRTRLSMANWQWGDGEREKVNPDIGILVQAQN
jgi:hypothetical protein